MLSCEFWKIFKNTIFTEHINASASELSIGEKFTYHHV